MTSGIVLPKEGEGGMQQTRAARVSLTTGPVSLKTTSSGLELGNGSAMMTPGHRPPAETGT